MLLEVNGIEVSVLWDASDVLPFLSFLLDVDARFLSELGRIFSVLWDVGLEVSIQWDVWGIYILSEDWEDANVKPCFGASLSVARGIASDIFTLDRSLSDVAGMTRDSPWLEKSLYAVGDIDEAPWFGRATTDVEGRDNGAPQLGESLGESLSDSEFVAPDTLWLGESLSDVEGKEEETPLVVIFVSDDGRTANDESKLGKSFHCCATALIWV